MPWGRLKFGSSPVTGAFAQLTGVITEAGGSLRRLEICSCTSIAASLLFRLGQLCITKWFSGLPQTTAVPSCKLLRISDILFIAG